MAGVDMSVNAVVGCGEGAVGEPLPVRVGGAGGEGLGRLLEDCAGVGGPGQLGGGAGPEG